MNDILSRELIFLIKYLEKKSGHKERFNQLILIANGFNVNVHDFMNDALLIGRIYVETVKKIDDTYVLKLTNDGKEIASHLSYNQVIIRRNVLWKVMMFIRGLIEWLIVKPVKQIPQLIKLIFSNKMAKFILFIAAVAGGIVAIIQLYKWYISGEI